MLGGVNLASLISSDYCGILEKDHSLFFCHWAKADPWLLIWSGKSDLLD